jgi:hypothetical protein
MRLAVDPLLATHFRLHSWRALRTLTTGPVVVPVAASYVMSSVLVRLSFLDLLLL